MTQSPLSVGGILYPGFEMLDLFGPLEMFSMLGPEQVRIHTIAQTGSPVGAAIGIESGIGPRVQPDFSFDDAPPLDVILVPGGFGTFPQLENEAFIAFLRERAESARVVASVCTGSALLAAAGLLDGRRATTNKQFFELTTAPFQAVNWVTEARWVEDGKFATSSGVSAGMDMSLALIAGLYSPEAADLAACGAEYSWHRDADSDPFAAELNRGMERLQQPKG